MITFKTPILFLIFNRPDLALQVFEVIRQIKPDQLFIAADGPRPHRPEDIANCRRCRSIIEKIDWPCEVKTLFRDRNLGCKQAVSQAITWFFEAVEEGIILEDDCLPNPTFFRYCEELLECYRDQTQVMHIAGANYLPSPKTGSYYFSKLFHIWGWATWKRAWKFYDVSIADWQDVRRTDLIQKQFTDSQIYRHLVKNWDKVFSNQLDTWDFQWSLACLKQQGVSIVPNNNMIQNLGFDAEATHTVFSDRRAKVEVTPIAFPLQHPQHIQPDLEYDHITFKKMIRPRMFERVRAKLYQILKSKSPS